MTEEEFIKAIDEGRVGWQVLDPDGNVVDSGGVSKGHMVGKLAQMVEQLPDEEEQ